MLGVIVTESLFRNHPDLSEGRLAKLRAAVVNMRALAGVARELKLGKYLRLGRGEEATGGRDKSSILADCVEALIGAVYLDRGFEVAGRVVHTLFDELMESSARLGAGLDWKTSLQELVAQLGVGVPEYVIAESGPGPRQDLRGAGADRLGHLRARHRQEQEGSRAAGRRDRVEGAARRPPGQQRPLGRQS